MYTLDQTQYSLPGQTAFYRGKVRDVYTIQDKYLVVVASDRISAFDVVLPKGIPYKGQVLNQVAAAFLEQTADIVPNWFISSPDPNVTVGWKCEPFKVEMVIRGYLTGHAWREYSSGKRTLCGVSLPEGMKENEKFPEPIITPTTKADQGHDEDIAKEELIRRGIVTQDEWDILEDYTRKLFAAGSAIADERGLILVDTKYEFGRRKGEILLIDEIHTPDSSRYFYKESYEYAFSKGEQPRQLSKEFVRQWLIENGFQGKSGQVIPEMSQEFINSVTQRYIELYENITSHPFLRAEINSVQSRVERNILTWLEGLKEKV